MKYNRRFARRRDRNEGPIVAALRAAGCQVELLEGTPDLLVGHNGVNHLLEVKMPLGPKGGKAGSENNQKQEKWLAAWGGQVAVVRTAGEALAAVGLKQPREPLTKRQTRVFNSIRVYEIAWGRAPTIRELGELTGIKSTNGVRDHLLAMKRKGWIDWVPHAARTLRVLP